MVILGIDPGDVHVGWALGTKETSGEWTVSAGEWEHDAAVGELSKRVWDLDELVMESFVLYADKASAQTWSPMKTSELIGKLTLLAEMSGVPVIMQGAYIKKATVAQMKARGLGDELKKGVKGGHSKDAVTHLWYRILKEGY